MAEARDFHCYSHVFENLGNPSIPRDHAAVRLVIQKPTNQGQHGKRIPSWMSKHPVLCSILKRLHDDHRYSTNPFGALAEFILIASTALRAKRNRHLGTFMRCCEAWKPVEHCFYLISSGCVDFQRLSQIVTRLRGFLRRSDDSRACLF